MDNTGKIIYVRIKNVSLPHVVVSGIYRSKLLNFLQISAFNAQLAG